MLIQVTTQTSTPNQKQYPISRIIARCKPADSNEWEYLVHYKGCSEYENRWIKLNPQTDSQLLRKYKNALKLRIVRKHKEQPPEVWFSFPFNYSLSPTEATLLL